MLKKHYLLITSLFVFVIQNIQAQSLSAVLYPCTLYGESITTMYADTTTNIVYIGGDFTSLLLPPNYTTTAIRNRIAAVDLNTGQLLPWTQSIDNGIIYSIKKAGDTIFAGGNFNSVNSQTIRDLVALDAKSSNTHYNVMYNFSTNDIIKYLYIHKNSIYAGGIIDTFNLNPVTHLVELNKTSGNLIRVFQNTINSSFDYFADVSKIEKQNNRLYFIAQTIDNAANVFDKSVFYFDLSIPTSSAHQLIVPSSTLYPVPRIDDFTILNTDLYVIGNFNQLIYSANSINRNKIACFNLLTNTFKSWSPNVSSNSNLSILNTNYGIKSSHIISFSDWMFFSQEYSTIINSIASASSSTANYSAITGSPALNSSSPISGSFFFDMQLCNGNLIVLNRDIYQVPSIGYRSKNNIFSYCLTLREPSNPIGMNANDTLCRSSTYNFYIPNRPEYSAVHWYYSGTGASIINNGNDTISIKFSSNATPGDLMVYGENNCGQNSTFVSKPIYFHALPNVNAGKDTSLNCLNNQQIILNGSSSISNYSLLWYSPINTTFTNGTLIHSAGNYILQVTDVITGCKNYDTLHVLYDTLSPVLNVASSYTITSCNPSSILVNAGSNNLTDTIFWKPTGNAPAISNPANLLGPASYLAIANGTNGCSDTAFVTVFNTALLPSITIPPGMPYSNGIYTLDTLTCYKDSILLNFTSLNPNAQFYIKRNIPYNDTIPNHSFVKTDGIYTVYIKDTITNCLGTPVNFNIFNHKNMPQLTLPIPPVITCSNTTVILNASSATPNTNLVWSGPTNFLFNNPAIANQTGTYTVVATNVINGCIKLDSIAITQQNSLLLNSSNDTIICKGDTVTLTANVIGGTPGFNYSWNNSLGNLPSITVNPSDTTFYSVNVTDAAGCIGTDTITIFIPTAISDSTLTFAPCDPQNPNGQIQIFAIGGIPPYQFSIDNGISSQTNAIFDHLNFGNYTILIRDSLNCKHTYTTSISGQSQVPNADFIISTTMMKADTFVVVDISNPRPDSIIWTFPPTVTVIDSNVFAPVIVSSDTGIVNVTMQAHFGTCISTLTKNVKFIKPDTLLSSSYGNGIESVVVFPNPNTGQFSVEVKLYKKQTFAIYIYNTQGIEQMRSIFSELDYGLSAFHLTNPGTYLIKVIAEYDAKSKIITVTH